MNDVLAKHGLNVCVLHMSKMKRVIFSLTSALTLVVSCEVLGLLASFVGSCWPHAMSKCCQYSTDDSKVSDGLSSISIKETRSILQKIIAWIEKSGKGQQ